MRCILSCVLILQGVTIVHNVHIKTADRSKHSQENNIFVPLLYNEKNNNIV